MRDDRLVTASESSEQHPRPAAPPNPAAPSKPAGLASPAGQPVALLVCAFLLELTAFAALGYAGWQLGSGIAQLFLVLAVPVAAIVVWGLFVAPKARVRLPGAVRLTVELLVYAAAVAGLLLANAVPAGIGLAVLVAAFQVGRALVRSRQSPA